MEKQRNTYITSLIFLSVLFITNIILVILNVYKLWLFIVFSCAILVCAIVFIVLLKNILQKIKNVKQEQSKKQSVGNYNIDLYEILGIPVQYNKDGTIKNIYELLGIEPMYDENGNRILTIYELLQIMPRFNANGEEIPTVISIKNKVKRIAKVDVSSRVLTRKLTEEEKEELAIREALGGALKKAEAEGDEKKQDAIKGMIKENANKKAQKKKEQKKESKPVEPDKLKFKLGKGDKAVGAVNINKYLAAKDIQTNINFSFLFDVKKQGLSNSKAVSVKPVVSSPVIDKNVTEKQSQTEAHSDESSQSTARRTIYVSINEEERDL